jgi:prolyl 4-hydroxylase
MTSSSQKYDLIIEKKEINGVERTEEKNVLENTVPVILLPERFVLNTEPHVSTVDNMLSSDECDYIMNKVASSLRESVVSGNMGGVASKGRTSKTTWLCYQSDPILKKIAERAAKILGTTWKHFEQLQIVKYEKGQEYRWHYDAYLTENCDRGKRCTQARGNRLTTVLFYLTDVEGGGETGFRDIKNAEGEMLKVVPQKGKGLIFENVYPGTTKRHPLSLHAGFPVASGEKWVANFWHREFAFDNQRSAQAIQKKESLGQSLPLQQRIPAQLPTQVKTELPFFSRILESNSDHNDYHKNYVRLYGTLGLLLGKLKEQNECLFEKSLLNKTYGNLSKEDWDVIPNNVLTPDVYQIIRNYYIQSIESKDFPLGDRQSMRFKARNDKIARLLNYNLEPLISKLCGRKMKASYTYLSGYVNKSELPAHKDRPECSLTCSYLIAKDEKKIPWPIYVEKKKTPGTGRCDAPIKIEESFEVDCEENGLMLFRGCSHSHMRIPYEGDFAYFLLLHYVED